MTTTFTVSLSSVDAVKLFVDATAGFHCDIDVKSGRYLVNGKSIMGLFSLDLSTPLTVEVHGEDGADFRRAVTEFITEG